MHGNVLHNQVLSHSTPKTHAKQYHNIQQQNEWLLQNMFDSRGIICIAIHAYLLLHEGRLTKLRGLKRDQNTTPLKSLSKEAIEDQNLLDSIVMPESITISLKEWWKTLQREDIVTVRYHYGRHKLAGKPSNRQEKQVIDVSPIRVKCCIIQ